MLEKPIFDIEIRLLLEAVFERYNYDFRHYSMASVRRRLGTALARFDLKTVSALQERVLHDAGFFSQLLQYLTVPTTEMFRDPDFFRALRDKVVPHLRTYPSLKIWAAGCSTGEEVYSIAILLEEEGLLDRAIIYATDINPVSLEKAAAGVYRAEDFRKHTLNYQKSGGRRSFSDYYSAAYESVIMAPRLRKNVLFADHSLATDSVFAEVQLVCCRNVLIYFNKGLQDRALRLFGESLCRQGFLGLGEKETLRFSAVAADFDTLAAETRLYRKH